VRCWGPCTRRPPCGAAAAGVRHGSELARALLQERAGPVCSSTSSRTPSWDPPWPQLTPCTRTRGLLRPACGGARSRGREGGPSGRLWGSGQGLRENSSMHTRLDAALEVCKRKLLPCSPVLLRCAGKQRRQRLLSKLLPWGEPQGPCCKGQPRRQQEEQPWGPRRAGARGCGNCKTLLRSCQRHLQCTQEPSARFPWAATAQGLIWPGHRERGARRRGPPQPWCLGWYWIRSHCAWHQLHILQPQLAQDVPVPRPRQVSRAASAGLHILFPLCGHLPPAR